MIPFKKQPANFLKINDFNIPVFTGESKNLDKKTVDSFGDEWNKFAQFDKEEIEKIGNDYFDILPSHDLSQYNVLDVGCGTGRWAKYMADKVNFIECIDPSKAVISAANLLKGSKNVRISMADVDNIPFEKEKFDLVYSLGVLHHIPDTKDGIEKCVSMVKPGGYFLVYLYYNLDNRSSIYKGIFKTSNLLRQLISRMPKHLKFIICDVLAVVLYLPFIFLAKLLKTIGLTSLATKVPLSYYTKTSWNVIRNDSLDRFGTPLEKRFSKMEIESMMAKAGLSNIKFSENPPYWHAIGQKK